MKRKLVVIGVFALGLLSGCSQQVRMRAGRDTVYQVSTSNHPGREVNASGEVKPTVVISGSEQKTQGTTVPLDL